MRVRTELRFEEIKENTNEKERARKIDDQEKWSTFFNKIVKSYFSDRAFERFHHEFEPAQHRLDCRVPSPGEFKCQQFSNPGSKKSKRKLLIKDPVNEEVKESNDGKKKKFVKNGCGKPWNSNLCLTKFNCLIEDDKEGIVLVVHLREYGQRCGHCQNRYENPSFEDYVLDIMMYWLLSMILEGIFDVVDPSIAVNPQDMGYYHRRRFSRKVDKDGEVVVQRRRGPPHNRAMCQACADSKGCGYVDAKKKPRKRRNRGANQNNQGNNGGTQPQGENAGGGQQQQGGSQQERGGQRQPGGNSHTQRRRRQRQRQHERQNNQQE
ncbi:uncharacterized protein [Clytia hemisphaerica]|uniref:3CxxC-type domain-containing protein n=1 Tax=Clytia hemisphaerica TaxID=252671 RepID=A0A7M5VFD4_9CNID|eukprot:TCONS_00056516-protein